MSGLLSRLVLAVTRWGWVRALFTRSGPGRRLAMRFVAGETLDDALAAARRLNADGYSVSLDHLGEHVDDLDLAEAALANYLACIDRIVDEELDANIAVKLTQLGLGVDDDHALRALETLAGHAAQAGITVTIDMEESDYTERTVTLYEKGQARHGNLGVALQAYLRRTPDDLARLAPLAGHIRLCKGAYDEPDEVAHQTRAAVDAAFDSLLVDLFRSEATPAIATHDDARISAARALIGPTPYEFQMLFGVRTELQKSLIDEGHPLRIYVPYGDAWYPYLTRRLAERPANLWFFMRAAVGR